MLTNTRIERNIKNCIIQIRNKLHGRRWQNKIKKTENTEKEIAQ